jgi:hypothetical protein
VRIALIDKASRSTVVAVVVTMHLRQVLGRSCSTHALLR